tara:strand:+ start:769 stop:2106 length:1338 start_codon:yes stop_codon:yes gene_type:complete
MNENFDLLLTNGNVFLPSKKIEKINIGVKNSKVTYMGNSLNLKSKKIINLKNLHVLPGCIDTQVHFREPGLTHKEDLFSGTKGAVLGGITGIFEMPNTKPPTVNKIEFEKKISIAEKKSFCEYGFYIGASKENAKNIKELEKLPGCCGVKIFMGSSTGTLLVEDDNSLKDIMKNSNRRIAIHSEDEYRLIDRKNMLKEKNVNIYFHEKWRDVRTAYKSTDRILNLVKKINNNNVHILHISTLDELKLIKKNKRYVTCEATPQHLFFHSPDCYQRLGSFAQMNPPIRNIEHKKALWTAIQDKTIDIIGSDHAPHTFEEKNKPYPNSPSGMTGVQTMIPILLNFVNQKKLSLADMVRLVSENPVKLFKISGKGKIKKNFDADFTIVDLKKEQKIENDWIQSKSGWTPYHGIKVKGWPVMTIIRGQVVMSQNKVHGKPSGKKFTFQDV